MFRPRIISIALVAILQVVVVLTAGTVHAGELSPGLERLLAGKSAAEPVQVLVVLPDQVAAPALATELRAAGAGRAARHAAVVTALQRTARTSQTGLLRDLERARIRGDVDGFAAHWLVNAVVVTARPDYVRTLAARTDVARVEADLVPEAIAPVGPGTAIDKAAAGIGIAPGVAAIGTRRVWDELGIDGTGAVVGIIDSGVDATHPALAARWRGHFAPAAETWLDAAQLGHGTPVDVQGHGTHVAGIMTGLAPDDTIGVAPGARWIATNGILAATGIFDNAIMASLEFMTDPDGDPQTIADVPDVVNNSWGVNESFAGYIDCDSRWWDLIDNCEAAGVVLVWAAGNEGSVSGTVRSPADRAANPTNCFAVGSTSNHAPFTISAFSSRGPSGCGGPYAIKPEVCAPGDTIYSALPGGGYIMRNGTSMATPHVAGVVALMRQANPDVDPVTIKDILMTTALDLGPVGQDNDYGWGRIDAYAAVRAVMGGIGTVTGRVTDGGTGQPVAGAVVRRDDGFNVAVPAANGEWALTLYAGPATFTATAFGYFPGTINVTIPDGGSTGGDIVLAARPLGTVSGTVRGPDLLPVAGAVVRAEDTPVAPAVTDTTGFYSLLLPAGTGQPYTLRATAPERGAQVASVVVDGDVTVDLDLPELTREDFESGGFFSYPWVATGDFPWQVDTFAPYEGTYSARGADIINGQSTGLYLDYYVAVPGDLSFWCRVSSEAGFDFLQFRLDGQTITSWSGEVDWTFYSIPVAKGHHQLEWRYVKDEAVSSGQDTAWLDLIELPSTGEELFPALTVGTPSVVANVPQGATVTRQLVLGNTGGEDLIFSLTAAPLGLKQAGRPAAAVTPPAPVATRPSEPTDDLPVKGDKAAASGAEGPAIRPAEAADSGGPDAYGYTWVDSDDPDGPVYAWEDISGIGTTLDAADDYSFGPIDLGFPFVFYGTSYGTVRINTNGFLSFISTSSPWQNPVLPGAALPNAVIAPFWDDLDPTAGGTVCWWADPGSDRFIVQYTDVPRYGTTETVTCQVVIAGNGSITCRYAAVDNGASCTVGVENATGDDGLTVLHDADGYLQAGLAVRFVPPGFLPWVSIAPLAGLVPPGEEAVVTIGFDTTDLTQGSHLATLTITSDDPDQPTTLVPLILFVEEPTAVPVADLPRAVTLSGAVPNPFNPRTEVRYALPRAADVSLRLYDLGGRLVRVLAAGRREAGPHVAVWDGRDAAGRAAASGTYFARLVVGDEVRVARMALIR